MTWETLLQSPWSRALATLLAGGLLGYVVRVFVIRRVGAFLERTTTDIDDLLLRAFRRHIPFWFLLGAGAVAVRVAPIADSIADLATRMAAVLFVVSMSFVAADLGAELFLRQARRSGGPVPATSLSLNILRGAILAVGGLLALSNLGISITPLLTALGVGSLAVALALQPTLTNFIAGVHISLARPIRVGDFVELEGGTQGYVLDIGWRAIRIRELPNNVIIVPNSRLAEMVVKNYAMPETEQAALVQVGVAYGSDMEQVERAVCEIGREVEDTVTGGVPGFAPFIRYHTFGDSSINFTVILRVKEFTDRYLITHEFMKRLKRRFDAERIEIPFPQRVVHVENGAAAGAAGARVESRA